MDLSPDWSARPAVVIASGPSAADAPLELVRGRAHVLAINDSWRLAPWADALYACDATWWEHACGAPRFRGLKYSQDINAVLSYPAVSRVFLVDEHRIVTEQPMHVGSGKNSGFQALNLAVQFGARVIALVGYDMRLDRGVHWHGRHPRPLNNPAEHAILQWIRHLDDAAAQLAGMGISVTNCSPVSALTAYPRQSFEAWAAAHC